LQNCVVRSSKPEAHGGRQSVRIVGGAWRGRRLPFPVVEGLRPTPDRLRETLFNWLQGKLAGATVLDLFAGSGALGFEALSRGAMAATLVERHPAAAAQLRESVATLCGGSSGAASSPPRATVLQADGYQHLLGAVTAFDGVFLDPPFADGREAELCKLLSSRGWLAAGSWVYVERAAARPVPELPPGFTLWREGRAGDVGCQLLRWEPPAP
jgi:16S rRNA (guanine966-N2)-methyltransferase